MGKHPAPISCHLIIRIINIYPIYWSSFDPKARYKQLWGFADPGAHLITNSSTNSKKKKPIRIFTHNFYLINGWKTTSSTPTKINGAAAPENVWTHPKLQEQGVGCCLDLGFLFSRLEPSQGSHTHSCKILVWNDGRSGQTWGSLLIPVSPKWGPPAAPGGEKRGKRKDGTIPEVNTRKFPV